MLSSFCWGVPGCEGPAAQRRDLSSPNPLDRARGAVAVSEAGDADAVHKLVDLLEDPDCAVRFYAIIGLRRLCGEDFGFRYYGDATERAEAVERWRAAIRAGEVHVIGGAGATATTSLPQAGAEQPVEGRGAAAPEGGGS